jgi:putative ABC transport system permease protein
MSVEVEFAKRLGLELGDTLRFDIQGVPVEGRVVQVREIRWQSFEPNFFVQFQSGVLDDAPKVWLAALPTMSSEDKLRYQSAIVGDFPNVSVIDISAVVARMLGIIEQIQLATNFMAALALLAGLALVYAIASHQAQERRWETNLLKVLGADFARIRAVVRWEFGLVALGAALLGGLASLALSWLLARYAMDAPWRPSWSAPLITSALVPLLCLLTAGVATRRILRERPLALLQRSS